MAGKINFLAILEKFLSIYLPKTKGLSANTIRSYRQAFRLLLIYLNTEKGIRPDNIAFADLEKDTITEWLSWIEESRGCSVKTRNQRLAAMVTFARFAIQEDFDHALALSSRINKTPKKRHPKTTAPVHLIREVNMSHQIEH